MEKHNPLLLDFNTRHNTVPFSKIKEEHFIPALDEAIKIGLSQVDDIVNNSETPDFKNTIEALEYSGELVGRIASVFFNLNSAETNDEIQKLAREFSPKLTSYSNDIKLNDKLFEKVKAVYENRKNFNLNKEQKRLLDKTFKSFSRNGALLNKGDKEKLREIDNELSKLSLHFGENVLAETNSYLKHISDESELKGLPEGDIEAAKQLAEDNSLEGFAVNLDFPSYSAVLKYAESRDLRKELFLAFTSRAFKGDEKDNSKIIESIVNLKLERAKLLGFNSHAEFVLAERMAETPQKVENFLFELVEKSKPAAQKELEELKTFAEELDSIGELQPWDTSYYSEKLRQKKFAFNSEELKPYFKLENVIDGVFKVASKLFNLKFEEVHDIDKYHEDVRTFEVKNENDKLVSVFYADFFPRKGKRGGAWMTSFKDQRKVNGIDERPHVSIVCNFTKPTKSKPSLLSFMEVTTLFHEFGHALHGMLSDVTYESLSGTSVYWDFVELPSQLLENWCYTKEALDLFAKHYETGELIPAELVEKIKASSTFMEGSQTLRQLNFGLLDMAWHGINEKLEIKNVKEFENSVTSNTTLMETPKETCISTAFSHIFGGGYSAGYYSYKWAEVLDADAFEYFEEKGVFSKEVADSLYENILSKGGSEHPAELYRRFRGRDAKVEALLKRAGLQN